MWWLFPFTVIALSLICSNEAPLNLPAAWAATTVPEALAPDGITVWPSTSTGVATVAENDCPASLLLELSVSPRRTVSTVPAGTTIGRASATAVLDLPGNSLDAAGDPSGLFASLAFVSLAGGLPEHAISQAVRNRVRIVERMRMRTSARENVSECFLARKHRRSMHYCSRGVTCSSACLAAEPWRPPSRCHLPGYSNQARANFYCVSSVPHWQPEWGSVPERARGQRWALAWAPEISRCSATGVPTTRCSSSRPPQGQTPAR